MFIVYIHASLICRIRRTIWFVVTYAMVSVHAIRVSSAYYPNCCKILRALLIYLHMCVRQHYTTNTYTSTRMHMQISRKIDTPTHTHTYIHTCAEELAAKIGCCFSSTHSWMSFIAGKLRCEKSNQINSIKKRQFELCIELLLSKPSIMNPRSDNRHGKNFVS